MPTIVVYSPFSGNEVKIRPQDVGRAVKDKDGKLFYVLQRSDGRGYYSAPSRAGGARDEQRYLRLLQKLGKAKRAAHRSGATRGKQASAVQRQPQQRAASSGAAHAGASHAHYGSAQSVRSSRESSRARAGRGGGLIGFIVVAAMIGGTAWLLTVGPLAGVGRTMWGFVKGLIDLATGGS